MKDLKFWGIILFFVFIGFCIGFGFNSEPTHTQTITPVEKVLVKAEIDMTNESMDIKDAVDLIILAKQQLERLELTGEKTE